MENISDMLSNNKKLGEDVMHIKEFLESEMVMEFSNGLLRAETQLLSLKRGLQNTDERVEESKNIVGNSSQRMDSVCMELKNSLLELKDQVLDIEQQIDMVDGYEQHLEGIKKDVRVITKKLEDIAMNVDAYHDSSNEWQYVFEEIRKNINEFEIIMKKHDEGRGEEKEKYLNLKEEIQNVQSRVENLQDGYDELSQNVIHIDQRKYLELGQFEKFEREYIEKYDELNKHFESNIDQLFSRAVELESSFAEVSNRFEEMDLKLSFTDSKIGNIKKSKKEIGRDMKTLTDDLSHIKEEMRTETILESNHFKEELINVQEMLSTTKIEVVALENRIEELAVCCDKGSESSDKISEMHSLLGTIENGTIAVKEDLWNKISVNTEKLALFSDQFTQLENRISDEMISLSMTVRNFENSLLQLKGAVREFINADESSRNIEKLKEEFGKSFELLSREIDDCRKWNKNATENITRQDVVLERCIARIETAESLLNVEELKEEFGKSLDLFRDDMEDCRESNENTTKYIGKLHAELGRCLTRIDNIGNLAADLNTDYKFAEASLTQCHKSVKDLAKDLSDQLNIQENTTKRNVDSINDKIEFLDKGLESVVNNINEDKNISCLCEDKNIQLEISIAEIKTKLLDLQYNQQAIESISYKVGNVSLSMDKLKEENKNKKNKFNGQLSSLKDELSELDAELKSFVESKIGEKNLVREIEMVREECANTCNEKITRLRGDLLKDINAIYLQSNSSVNGIDKLQSKIESFREGITEIKLEYDASMQELEKRDLDILEEINERYLTLSDTITGLDMQDLRRAVSNNSKVVRVLRTNLETVQKECLGIDVITEVKMNFSKIQKQQEECSLESDISEVRASKIELEPD